MTYAASIEFLYNLRLFGTKLGLENTCRLADIAGCPQDRLRFIHVAGTNGKGSTCAMLESIYRAAGIARVGLFTSPHLVSFGERIQIDRQPISQPEIIRLVGDLQKWLEHFPAQAHPTFFEAVTVMAMRYFADRQCELVIWETGLGGRLDATNVVTPLASVITNIQFDHQEWLGHTLDEIAAEKAGIIKPGAPVITGAAAGQGLEVIAATARERKAPLTVVPVQAAHEAPLATLDLPLRGEHQRFNAAVALATVRTLQAQLPCPDAAIRQGLARVHWPGRLQLVACGSDRKVLLDGAHNAAGAEALAHELHAQFPGVKPTLIFGVLSDKDWHPMSETLARHAGWIILVPVKSQRGLPPENLLPLCRSVNPGVPVAVCEGLSKALELTSQDPFVVITGSLYLVGEAMELLGLSAAPLPDERGLNEWSGTPQPRVRPA